MTHQKIRPHTKTPTDQRGDDATRSRGRTSGAPAGVMPPCGQPKRRTSCRRRSPQQDEQRARHAEPGEPTSTAAGAHRPGRSACRTAEAVRPNSLRPPAPASLQRRRRLRLRRRQRRHRRVADYSTWPGSRPWGAVSATHRADPSTVRRRVTVRPYRTRPAAYLDAATAAPLHPVARQALLAALDDGWADPGQALQPGPPGPAAARRGPRRRRRDAGGTRREVTFTASGTTAAHAGGAGRRCGAPAQRRATLVHSAIEHSAVLHAADRHVAAGGSAVACRWTGSAGWTWTRWARPSRRPGWRWRR